MKVSIITTCYNRGRTIRRCLNSALSQKEVDLEYIVIDGASTDASPAIIDEYTSRLAYFTSEPDHGMYDAINKGIRAATGDIVGLLHSDDIFYDDHTLAKVVAAFEQTGADLVYGNGLFVDPKQPERVVRDWRSGTYSKDKVKRGWLPLHTTVFVRRDCLLKHGLYDTAYKIAADSDFLVRYLYEATLKVVYLNHYFVRMDMGGLSTNPEKMKEKWREDLAMYKSHGFPPRRTLARKILSKIPQFVRAKLNQSVG